MNGICNQIFVALYQIYRQVRIEDFNESEMTSKLLMQNEN